MNNKGLFYQESKKVNSIGLAISYGGCLILALLLGYLYSAAITLIPIIYVTFFITIGFGIALGLANRLLVRVTHNRHKKSQLIQALISGLLANYFQWTAFILYAYNGEIPSINEYLSNLHWIAIPENFFGAIAEINQYGLWSVFGIQFKGFGLTFVWILEAFIITAIPIIAIYKTKVYPYSELLQKWYPKYTLFKDFESISMVSNLLVNLQTDSLKVIQKLRKGNAFRYSKIHVFYHKEEQQQYLTFEKIFIESRGKKKKNCSIVVNNFAIDKEAAESILNNFENKRERIEII